MPKILLVTVGGSHQPIVTAIRALQPDRVIFVCSDGSKGSKSQVIGEGSPCEVRRGTEVIERLPNIPTQVGLSDRFQQDRDLILIQEPDDLSECYLKTSLCIRSIQQELPDAQTMADYTGGTKSMSVGLAMAALDYQVTLYVTTTVRTNIIKIERGELPGQATVAPVVAQRTLGQFLPIFLQQYNYPAAIAQLKRLLSSMELPPETTRQIRTLYACCCGLDAWDRFEHREALEFFESQMKYPEIRQLGLFLKRVINSRGQIDEKFDFSNSTVGHGYEIVQDLILNAERRAAQERYDDAVGRLYRALELLAQICLLKSYGIKTGDVDIQQLPESLRDEYEQKRSSVKKKIQLALKDSYELLSKLPDDPIGQLYQQNANKIINALEVRNNSLFAHGFQPITSSDYEDVSKVFVNFIQSAIETVTPHKLKLQSPQFPTTLEI
ncbi:TIGR02710 family CRISPR-associated protein [Fischerella muscicola CCMEE 5323]|uniref:TIGR02710 family CRISPR-associated protein n=1 Tax=Fischerella muscicola CCMEE 5323 TaxID=2019572 RepID=A0A2N6K549_FISMU|nr:TIGR02710 family CRISPR-associated CARF protein [Fischerella muscicola]PLZ91536.1 TIGR02710 family CRISPR-associated protein [Fischerella muscicola CCMEE 5323]